ncbi:MAG: MTH1187 family thiamine-binding protein [Promethearchaeati archaeon SRVP18_Atabeyarchaeia-1]
MTVMAELSVVPIGTGSTELSTYIAEALKTIKQAKGIKWQLTPMSTIIETDSLDKLFALVKQAHESLFKAGAKRVSTLIKIDDRRDIAGERMKGKVDSVLSKI